MNVDLIQRQIDSGIINSPLLLSGSKLLLESNRQSADYLDKNYFPFYYHLGKQIEPKHVLQIGTKLGLVGFCFLKSCKSVDSWTFFDKQDNVTSNIVSANLKFNKQIKTSYYPLNEQSFKKVSDEKFDVCFLSENFNSDNFGYLDFLWSVIKGEGLLVVDYINLGDFFYDFCRVKNRKPIVFNTRYGVGIVER